MRRQLLAMLLICSGLLFPATHASARPDAWTTRDVQITGTFQVSSTSYRVRATYKERSVLSIGDASNPSGGPATANPREYSFFVTICKDACAQPSDTLCSVTTADVVVDEGSSMTVDSTATNCPVSFKATISGYGAPRLVPTPTGNVSLVLDANATFAPGASVFNQTAIGSQGRAMRTLAGVTVVPV